jgi:hypothetical protein
MLTVVGHTDQSGGWYQVKGPTLAGWISADPTFTGSGPFGTYSSPTLQLTTLYPATWTHSEAPPASVVFHAPGGAETVVMTTAATTAALGRGRPGYQQSNDQQVVVCGVTGDLVTFTQVTTPASSTPLPGGVPSGHYLVQVHLTLDPQHALGIDANLAGPAQLQPVLDIVNSVSFPYPRCGH